MQRALKAPESERVKIDFLLMITNFMTGEREKKKGLGEIEATVQNVRITTRRTISKQASR